MRNGLCICLGLAAAVMSAAPVFAAAPPPPPTAEGPIGYGGAKVQLNPIMSPYRTPSGIRYQVITVRLVLDVGVNERPACFMAPVVHEKILFYLYKNMPSPADLRGQRRDVFLKEMLDLATATTDRGFYAGVELVGDTEDQSMMDPKSKTLTSQCK